jgi:hypothetical protein
MVLIFGREGDEKEEGGEEEEEQASKYFPI